VPETYLKPSAEAQEQGLKGEYFDNLTFAGTPKMTRTDPVVNFNFFHTAPPGFSPLGFSVRWTGVLTPPTAGTYEIGFRMMRRKGEPVPDVKVWIDGELVVTPALAGITADTNARCIAGNCSLSIVPIKIDFRDTKPHQVRIDYVRATEDRTSAFDWVPPKDALQDAAVRAARDSEVVVAFVGLSPDLEGEEMPVNYPGFEGGDRTSLVLPDAQRRLLQAVKKTGKPLVVVYLTGGSISDPWVEKNADAVVQAWYPGEAAGKAIAGVLTGEINPAGRLPYTIYRSVADLPPFEDYSMDRRTYRYFKGPVLYPFGHGLSYSRFSYTMPVLSRASIKAGDDVSVSMKIRNDGTRDGDEVVQVYLAKPGDHANPVLAGFRRIHLRAGTSEVVKIELNARMQSQVDATGARQVKPGVYAVYVGGGQPKYSPGVATRVTVEGTATLGK
jgi:beta-glucosidase